MTESGLSTSDIELCTGKRSPPFLGSTMGRLRVVGRDRDVTSFLEGWISRARCSPGSTGCALWSTCALLIKKAVVRYDSLSSLLFWLPVFFEAAQT